MSTINNSDKFLVARNDTNYSIDASNLMSTIQDTDFMLIERGGESFKVSCQDVKDQLGGSPAFSSVTLDPLTLTPSLNDPNIVNATTNIPLVNGSVPADVVWEWCQYDNATGEAGKTVLRSVTNRQDADSVTLPTSSAEKYIGLNVTYLAVTVTETQRCAVEAYPGLAQVTGTFLLVGGGSSGRGGTGSTGASNSAGGGGGGVITSVSGDVGTNNTPAVSPITFVTERSTYNIQIGGSGSASSIDGPREALQENDPPVFNYLANGGDSVPSQNGGSWYPSRGGDSGSIVINGTTTDGFDGGSASRNGAVSSACLQIDNACDQDCSGHYYGAGAGASERPPNVGQGLPDCLDGGDGVQTNILSSSFWVAGGAKGTERCNTGGGVNGQGRDSYGGGGIDYDPGNDGVLIIKYIKSVSIENADGGLTFTTVEEGDQKITTFTGGSGVIKFVN